MPISRGKVSVNRLPRPRPSLEALSVPPCSSVISFAIASPSPRPPCSRVVD